MCRIGLDKPETKYLECVKKLTKNPFFFAIMGGTPRRAHLFLKQKNNYFGYLDPHTTYKTAKTMENLPEHSNEYISQL